MHPDWMQWAFVIANFVIASSYLRIPLSLGKAYEDIRASIHDGGVNTPHVAKLLEPFGARAVMFIASCGLGHFIMAMNVSFLLLAPSLPYWLLFSWGIINILSHVVTAYISNETANFYGRNRSRFAKVFSDTIIGNRRLSKMGSPGEVSVVESLKNCRVGMFRFRLDQPIIHWDTISCEIWGFKTDGESAWYDVPYAHWAAWPSTEDESLKAMTVISNAVADKVPYWNVAKYRVPEGFPNAGFEFRVLHIGTVEPDGVTVVGFNYQLPTELQIGDHQFAAFVGRLQSFVDKTSVGD